MKSTKSTQLKPAASASEECGKWLDTAELKEKKQKKYLTRPISKLLNPMARSGGYSVAVALSFTQTKLNMPVTRQSSISSFFSPKPKDHKPIVARAEMYTSMQTKTLTGAKRKHGMTLEPSIDSDLLTSQTSEVDQENCDSDYEKLTTNDSDDQKEQRFLHLICGFEPEEEEPPEKRRPIAHYTDQNVLETQEYWNKDASVGRRIPDESQRIPETETFSQGHDLLMVRKLSEDSCEDLLQSPRPQDLGLKDKRVLRDQNSTIVGPFETSRHVNENHKRPSSSAVTNKDQKQAWYKQKPSPMKLIGKENSWPASPIRNSLSTFKQHSISSPAKCNLKDKYTFSPKRKPDKETSTEMIGETLAVLFTQDSEGFRVIAHRDQHSRSQLKDQSNLSLSKESCSRQSVGFLEKEDEESDLEPEMLFTQDSEGNMVIKH
ncbi:aurora kinase A and ninein-interacting protein [Xyrauchen texanus]|uniref:aurora kinase A and ninein-interacting protein n=1 Tax=Xyrauchen texanus TaxID=154827 RepID=UPI002241E09A|nr:aurora kinase A and ninein-interacting protein [Xyrauchen texanus]